jgi:hypothetical protein
MALERIAMAAWALVPAGVIVFAAGTMLGQEPGPKAERKVVSSPSDGAKNEKAPVAPLEKVLVDPLERELLRAAHQRLEAQRAFYEEGRITIDRFVAASQEVMEVERMVSQTIEERLAAMQRHVDRLKEIEAREEKELEVGKGTVADVAEAHQNRLLAEVLLKKSKMPDKSNPALRDLERRLSELERQLEVRSSAEAREVRLMERRLRNVEQKLDSLLKKQAELRR